MAGIKDRKRTRFNRLGVIRLGYKVFWCKGGSGKDAHKAYPTRWAGEGREACGKCGEVRTGLTDRNTMPFQSEHFVLWDAPEVLAFYRGKGIAEKDVQEIDIMFPFDNRDQNFIASYQVWAGGDCVCQGDGELVDHAIPTKAYQDGRGWHVKKVDGETLVANGMACRPFSWNGTDFAEGDHVPCSGSGEEKLYPHCNLCKLNSMLKVMMADPDLFRMGYYRIATGSDRNYDHFDTMFKMLPENVQGIPFKLRLVEEPTKYIGDDGKSHKTMKWFLHLEPSPDYMRELFSQRAANQIGQSAQSCPPLLPDSVEEPEEYAAEEGQGTVSEQEILTWDDYYDGDDLDIHYAANPPPVTEEQQPKAQSGTLPPEQWPDIDPPTEYIDLWRGEMWRLIGYQAKQHALNVLKQYDPQDAGEAWGYLVEHQKSKLPEPGAGALAF